MPLHLPDLSAEITDLLSAQHGAVTTAQLGRLGLSRGTVADLTGARRLIRIARGAYTLPELWDGSPPWRRYELIVHGVALRTRGDRPEALSHVSAAVVWELPLMTTPSLVHLVSTSRSCGRRGIVFRHRDETGSDLIHHAGTAVTTLRRTVVDCCATLPFADSVALADAALARFAGPGAARAEIAVAQELYRDDLIDLAARRGHAAAKARGVLLFADGRSGSPAESKARVVMHGLGFRSPELQMRIETVHGGYYPDFAFPDLGVLVEIDGMVKVTDPYGGDAPQAIEAERRRHIRLQEMGWEIVRLAWPELGRPETVREKIRSATERARHRGIAQRPG